jgi:AcrR family transcriptional regulator
VREPLQTRSRERFDRIVAAMEGLLRERPFEEVTIRGIAQAAGVPTGTLYQFFDGKDDLMERIALRIEAELDGIVDRELAPAKIATTPGQALLSLIVAIDRMQQAHAGFVCLARTDPSAGSIGALAERLRRGVQGRMEAQFAAAFPGVAPDDRRDIVLVLTSFMMSVFSQAPQGEPARARFVAEGSRMLALYLQDRLTNASV